MFQDCVPHDLFLFFFFIPKQYLIFKMYLLGGEKEISVVLASLKYILRYLKQIAKLASIR